MKAILAMVGGRRHGLAAVAVDDVEHARRAAGRRIRSTISRLIGADRLASGRRSCRRPEPGPASRPPSEREVPGDDLADDAQRLVEVVGDGGLVEVGQGAFLARTQPAK